MLNKQTRSLILAAFICVVATGSTAQTMTVTYPSAATVTPPLSQLPDGPKPQGNTEHAHRPVPSHAGKGGGQDTAVQGDAGPLIGATGGIHFDGPGANGFAPSDSNMAVGPNHIFAAVNSVYQIYTKTGASIVGPKTLSSLWTGVGGGCSSANAGDVVVQYDKLADRWILTQLSSLSSPYGECIAVSTSGDPTGTYSTYYYTFANNLPDYPKFGVWPTTTNSAYLATYNQFANGASFAGAALCAYDRSAMIAGAASPAQVCFTISDASYLPSDVDGSTAPVDGSPGYFLTYETLSSLRIWKLAPNFANVASSTLTQVTPDLSVTPFSELCNEGTCVTQAGTTNKLDSLGDRPMYRLAYRNFGDHQAMVFNHSVTSGPRWYELRANPGADFSVFQLGTFAPDSAFRWMGSAAMDQAGDLAIGYSASSSSIHPAIRYSGRVPSDPPGTLESEASIIEGAGSQTNGLHRWGDYSSLRIDPSDDCTFWYINQYLKSSGAFNWSTGIGSFKFTNCSLPPPDAAPVLLTASAVSATEVDLTWTNHATNATGNRILRCAGAACTPSASIVSLAATATSYHDTSAAANTTYGYAVEAFNGSGVKDSNVMFATTPLPPPPTPPNFTSATAVSSTEIDLAWSNNATNATGIRILRCSGSCAPVSSDSIATLAATATSYNNTGLGAAQTFTYKIEAFNAGGNGDSGARTATTLNVSQFPAAPVLSVGSPGKNSLTLTWTESTPPSVTGFDILRCTGSGCTPTALTSVGSAARTFTDSSLARHTTYTYRVRANNGSGSTLSNSASGSTH